VPAIVLAILRRSVSERTAFELIVTGEILPARKALEMGMVNHVFEDATFEQEVETYLARLAAKSVSAVTLCKSLLHHTDGMQFESAIEAGIRVNAMARLTDDCRRGIEGFVKKR
jgi:methylglutaconyl-CoA hydratase